MNKALDIFNSDFPSLLVNNKIRLRELSVNDKQRYLDIMSCAEVNKYLSDEDIPLTIAETEQEIRYWRNLFYRKMSIFWCIEHNNNMIGTVGFNNLYINNRRGEVSYELMHKFWKQGIMTASLMKIMDFGFNKMNLMRIEAKISVDNIASEQLLIKLGFCKEGLLKKYRIVRNEPIDVTLYAKTI